MKKLLTYLKPLTKRIVWGTTIKFVGTIMDLLLPWILAHLIDEVIPTRNINHIMLWGIGMLVCSAVALLGNVIANRMAAKVARYTTSHLRHDLFEKISHLSCRQMDDFTIPSLESRLTTDTYHIHQMVNMIQRMGIRAPILLLGGIVVTVALEPALAMVLLATLPFIGFVTFRVSHKGIPLFVRMQHAVDQMVRTVREDVSGVRVIKALSKGDYEKERFDKVNKALVERETAASVMMATSNPLINLFLNLGLTMVIIVGAYRANVGLTQTGKIIAFLSYFTIMSTAMISLSRIFTFSSKGAASAERVAEVLNAPEEPAIAPRDYQETDEFVVFDNVTFSYNKITPNLFGISFSLKRGETLGIIGPTGCGKSTIIHLLLRFYDPDKGTIRFHGDRLDTIPLEELYTSVGVVFQNDTVFAETVEENIRFGRSITEQQLAEATESAQAKPFISELEEGYDYQLTAKGTNLSGGQKQRLLIARALAARPDLLILDDASSALDYQTDAQFRTALRQNYQGVTTVIVAQRVSSILYADKILVLDEGRIIGSGRHEELMKTCEAYQEISRSQMGGEADA